MGSAPGTSHGVTGGAVLVAPDVAAGLVQAVELFALASRGASAHQVIKAFSSDLKTAKRMAHKALHPDKFASLGRDEQKIVDLALAVFTTAFHAFTNPGDDGFERTFANARVAAAKHHAWAAHFVSELAPLVSALTEHKPLVASRGPVAEQIAVSAIVHALPPLVPQNANARVATAAYAAVMNLGARDVSSRVSAWA